MKNLLLTIMVALFATVVWGQTQSKKMNPITTVTTNSTYKTTKLTIDQIPGCITDWVKKHIDHANQNSPIIQAYKTVKQTFNLKTNMLISTTIYYEIWPNTAIPGTITYLPSEFSMFDNNCNNIAPPSDLDEIQKSFPSIPY